MNTKTCQRVKVFDNHGNPDHYCYLSRRMVIGDDTDFGSEALDIKCRYLCKEDVHAFLPPENPGLSFEDDNPIATYLVRLCKLGRNND